MLVYVLSKLGKPLMPCQPHGQETVKDNKAKVVSRTPFIIQLLFGSSGHMQEIVAGFDTGSKTMGVAAIAVAPGKVLYQSETTLRTEISNKMTQRSMYRRTRRGRKTRYRQARFENRGKKGKLAPSIQNKVESHLREKKYVESILPIHHWKVELASFDIHKISNPKVSKEHGWSYQQGKQKNFYNVKAYILSRDKYACQQCKGSKGTLHVHHIIFRSKGALTPQTISLLSVSPVMTSYIRGKWWEIFRKLKKKVGSKTKHATEIGIIKSRLKTTRPSDFEETFGYETKFKREGAGLPKTHYYDAVAICLSDGKQLITWKRFFSKNMFREVTTSRLLESGRRRISPLENSLD